MDVLSHFTDRFFNAFNPCKNLILNSFFTLIFLKKFLQAFDSFNQMIITFAVLRYKSLGLLKIMKFLQNKFAFHLQLFAGHSAYDISQVIASTKAFLKHLLEHLFVNI